VVAPPLVVTVALLDAVVFTTLVVGAALLAAATALVDGATLLVAAAVPLDMVAIAVGDAPFPQAARIAGSTGAERPRANPRWTKARRVNCRAGMDCTGRGSRSGATTALLIRCAAVSASQVDDACACQGRQWRQQIRHNQQQRDHGRQPLLLPAYILHNIEVKLRVEEEGMGQSDVRPELRGLPAAPERASAAETIYYALRESITSGTLAPGARLREIPLAHHFGASTTPVREALRRLDREGLVRLAPNRGATVAAFDPQEVAALYEARQVLEQHAVRLAAHKPERDFAPLEVLLSKMAAVINEPDQIAFNQLDVEFHRRLNDLGGNIPIAELAEQVHRRIQGVRVRCAVHLAGRPAISHAQHEALVAAVHARDADQAVAILQEHLRSVRAAVIRVLADGAEA
jgi:DNA-binding GntR family transcriptional regulator